MTAETFSISLTQAEPPPDLTPALLALWHDGRGDWAAAHHIAQDMSDPDGAWIHAYLHRKEGDEGNAAYWYRRARRAPSRQSLEDEWRSLVSAFLSQQVR